MNEFLIYLVQVALGQAICYIIFLAVLSRGTHFSFNRFFLLSGLVIPLGLPLIQIPVATGSAGGLSSFVLEQVQFSPVPESPKSVFSLSLSYLPVLIYLAGVLWMILRNVRRWRSIRQFCKHSVLKNIYGQNIRVVQEGVKACSFLRNIYLDEETASLESVDKILLHEKVHIRQWHSLDVIIFEFLCMLLWFNPFLWKMRSALKEMHEYLADEGVKNADPDTSGYMILLANLGVGVPLAFSNQFNQSLTLKRLNMMTKNRSGKFAPLKVLLGIPLLVLLVVAFSVRHHANALVVVNESVSAAGRGDVSIPATPDLSGVMDEVPPQYPGGQDALVKFIQENLRYPEAARKAGRVGTVYIQFTVTTTGSVTDVKVKRALEPSLDAEALRVVSLMPEWTPGTRDGEVVAVEMVLPVQFKLEEK